MPRIDQPITPKTAGGNGQPAVVAGRPAVLPMLPAIKPGEKNRIRCAGEVLRIADLVPDPNNARLHPERNLQSIRDSLNLYGQCSPLTVRKQDQMVMKGNGTLAAAQALGWTELACSVMDMTLVEAAGYSLADNRTAELALWDFEVVGRIERLLVEQQVCLVGWTRKDILLLRRADFANLPQLPIEDVESNGSIYETTCPECGCVFPVSPLGKKKTP